MSRMKAEHVAKQAKLRQEGLKASFKNAEVTLANKAIAKFFYENGISFSAATSEPTSSYQQMIRAIQQAPSSFVPPTKKTLAGPLLDECYDDMLQNLKARDPEGKLALKFGAAYVSDGWDSVTNRPLINSAFISNNDGGMFWRSVDTSGKVKSAEYTASLMILQDIYDYGCTSVTVVITDTCATMRKCWDILEDEFPWIMIVPCLTHVLSLLMKDIAKAPQVKEVIAQESLVVNWFANHHIPLAILRRKTMEKFGIAKELVKSGATRFGTNTLVGERLLQLKAPLSMTVVDEEYAAQKFKDGDDQEEENHGVIHRRQHKGGTAKRLVQDDEGFWSQVEEHVKVTGPAHKMLRRHDSSAPTAGKLYSGWFELWASTFSGSLRHTEST